MVKRLIGNYVEVHLKQDDEIISGIVFDMEDDHVYVQQDVGVLITVPRENIKYYSSGKAGPSKVVSSSSATSTPPPAQVQAMGPQSLQVFIDRELVSDIPVDDSVDLSQYSSEIQKIATSDPEVASCLVGRIQAGGEYYPGQLYLITQANGEVQAPQSGSSSFDMGGGQWTNQFLSPLEAVSRLNKSVRKPKEKPDE